MTTTPAPGDLSARLPRALYNLHHFTEHCISAAEEGVDYAVPRGWLEAATTMGIMEKVGRGRWAPTEQAELLVAVLSALPAAGGEPVGYVRKDGSVEWYVDHGFSRIPNPGSDLYTTPQPSAVSFDPASIGPFTAAAALMQATDAAVGAQGDGYVPQLNLRGVLHEALTFVLDHAEKDEDAEKWTLTRELRAHLAASAAPAAGKGVDDALALAVRFHETYERLAPSFGYETRQETRAFDPTTPNGRLMVAVCNDLFAALTLQPVAGGGDADFELWQDGEFVAGSSGPRAEAWREILHYAAQYEQDGAVTIMEVIRRPLAAPRSHAD